MIFNPRVVQLTGRRIALTPPTNFVASPGNASVSLTWEDPGDETAGGVVVAEWEFTRIVRKVGSPPVNETDGTVVTESTVKNQYMSTPYVDSGLVNGTTYYYGAFACSVAGAWSDGAFAGAIPVQGTYLGDLAEGTLVNIKENGSPVQFYVAKVGYEPTLNSPDRVLMVRKNLAPQVLYNQATTSLPSWDDTNLYSWLNTSYKNTLSAYVRSITGNTSYAAYSNDGQNVFSSSVFTLSAYELGISKSPIPQYGTPLSIASTLLIIPNNTLSWYTRSVYMGTRDFGPVAINADGTSSYASTNGTQSARPCFTLPYKALVDPDMNLIESGDIPPTETPLGDLVEGTLITIQENGAPVEFYVAKQGYEPTLNGPDRVLVVRKDIYSNQVWDALNVNAYATSDIDAWFNSTYKALLSAYVQNAMEKSSFYYTIGNGNYTVATLQRSVFSLSMTELNGDYVSANVEGSVLPIASTLQTANLNGAPSYQWTRTAVNNLSRAAVYLHYNGHAFNGGCDNSFGARPCFTLPASALVDGNLALIEEV